VAIPIFDDPVSLFDDPLYGFDGDLVAQQLQRKAATRILEESEAGLLLETLKPGDELWVYERHADEYEEIDAVDETQIVLLEDRERFVTNSSDFNYALLQVIRETALGFESNADEVVIYRGNAVKVTKPALAQAIFLGWFVEVAFEDYRLTVVESEATHGLIDLGDGDWQIVPKALVDGTVRIRRIGVDTYRGY
jgi:hypothetical protein